MSRKHKVKNWTPPGAFQAGTATPAEVASNEIAQIAQLIAHGNFGFAVDVAKEVHRRCGSPSSETLLVDAYAARISSLAERGLERDAQALFDLVSQRHSAYRERLQSGALLKPDDLDARLRPLADLGLPNETRGAIEKYVRTRVSDLTALATCRTLPANHPLRVGAGALAATFEAVTSGPIDEYKLSLPEISRQSPLAPWKILLRAVAAFYRRDDALCARLLATIDSDAAAGRLVKPLWVLLGQAVPLNPAGRSLVEQCGGSLEGLRASLEKLDLALEKKNQSKVGQEIRSTLEVCLTWFPALLEKLKQHISVRAFLSELPAEAVSNATGVVLREAHFWRLLARAFEERRQNPMEIPMALSLWEEFRKHALREQIISEKGPEIAALYLHMADVLRRLPEEDFDRIVGTFASRFKGHIDYYRGQPPEIRALQPLPGRQNLDFLNTYNLLERACDADPCPEYFRRWLEEARRLNPRKAEYVAMRWRVKFQGDAAPLLYLMEAAERTNALERAFKWMKEAERIDGLNPAVRRARLRLLVSLAIRHLQKRKPHLAEPELRAIEELPQAQQGDRPAFVAALRWVCLTLCGAHHDAAVAQSEVERRLDSAVAARIVLTGVSRACKLKLDPPTAPNDAVLPLATAVGRACELGEDMGVTFFIAPELGESLMRELASGAAADPRGLAALGESALRMHHLSLAYAVSVAGLAARATNQAAFLFLRARALPAWEDERQETCVSAAAELARRHRNLDLLKQIGEWREAELAWLGPPDESAVAMTVEQVDSVLLRELKEREYPTPEPNSDEEECDCPVCRAGRRDVLGIPRELADMVEEFGPEMVAKAMTEMLFDGQPKPKKKRSRTFGAGEMPF